MDSNCNDIFGWRRYFPTPFYFFTLDFTKIDIFGIFIDFGLKARLASQR
jgi:hypothetical protein